MSAFAELNKVQRPYLWPDDYSFMRMSRLVAAELKVYSIGSCAIDYVMIRIVFPYKCIKQAQIIMHPSSLIWRAARAYTEALFNHFLVMFRVKFPVSNPFNRRGKKAPAKRAFNFNNNIKSSPPRFLLLTRRYRLPTSALFTGARYKRPTSAAQRQMRL